MFAFILAKMLSGSNPADAQVGKTGIKSCKGNSLDIHKKETPAEPLHVLNIHISI